MGHIIINKSSLLYLTYLYPPTDLPPTSYLPTYLLDQLQ